jgi:hypothetical protein
MPRKRSLEGDPYETVKDYRFKIFDHMDGMECEQTEYPVARSEWEKNNRTRIHTIKVGERIFQSATMNERWVHITVQDGTVRSMVLSTKKIHQMLLPFEFESCIWSAI